MKYLVFDTETSGLPPFGYRKEIFKLLQNNQESWSKLLDNWPYLMQMTYIIFDTETNQVTKIYNKYVETPEKEIEKLEKTIGDLNAKEDFKSKKGAGVLQGNLDRWSASGKVNVCDLMNEFLTDINSVDGVVAHNINFDLLMMIATGKRVGDKCDVRLLDILNYDNFGDKKICTMKQGTQMCKIPFMEADGVTPKPLKTYTDKNTGEQITNYKNPTLSNLYQHLFGNFPREELLHDSLFDVILTLRVFIKIKLNKDICLDRPSNPNSLTKELYDKLAMVSPDGDACAGVNALSKVGGKKRTRKLKGKKLRKSKKVKRRKRGGMDDEPIMAPLTLSMLNTSDDSNDSIPDRTDLEESSINQSFGDLDLSMIDIDEEDGPNQLDISVGNMEPLTLSMLNTSQNDSVLDKTDEEDESFGGKARKSKKTKKKSKKTKRKNKKSKKSSRKKRKTSKKKHLYKKRLQRGSGLTLSRPRVYNHDFFKDRYMPGERLTINTHDKESHYGKITNINKNNLVIEESDGISSIPYDQIINIELDMYKK